MTTPGPASESEPVLGDSRRSGIGIGKAWTTPSIIETPRRPTTLPSVPPSTGYGSFGDSPASTGVAPGVGGSIGRRTGGKLRFGGDPAHRRPTDASLTDRPASAVTAPNSETRSLSSRTWLGGRRSQDVLAHFDHQAPGSSQSFLRRSLPTRRGSGGAAGSTGLRSQQSRATSLFFDAVGPTSPPHEFADLPPIDLDRSGSSSSSTSSGSSSDDEAVLDPAAITTRTDRTRESTDERREGSALGFSTMADDDHVPHGFGHGGQMVDMEAEEAEALLDRTGSATRSRSRSGRSASGVAAGEPAEEKQHGVLKAEIISRRLRSKQTGWGIWTVYLGIYLLSVTTSIETNALPVVEPFFLSLFGAHGLLSSVGIVTNIAYAVGKPPMAKIMDVFGRSEGVALAAAFYFVGAMLTTSAHNVVQYSIARIAAALGYQGLQLAQQIVVADTSTLASRALLTSTISSPWIVTTWIGPWIGEAFKNGGEVGYRSLYAVFGVAVPIVSLFLAGLLWWEWRQIMRRRRRSVMLGSEVGASEAATPRHRRSTSSIRRERRGSDHPSHRHHHHHGAKPPSPSPERGRRDRPKFSGEGSANATSTRWRPRTAMSLGKETWTQLDVVGIVLLTIGCSVLLLPLTLAARRPKSWGDPKLYVLLICGIIVLALFALYEAHRSKCPILPAHLMRDRTIVAGSLLCFFHFLCQFIYESYFTSFLQVARFETARNAQYIAESYIFTACVSALICGLLVKWSRRYKIWVIVGILIHAVGAILMVRFRRLDNPTWELVLSQVIAGAGGGFTTLGAQLGVQSVVSHQEVGVATAVFLTITQIGGAVGSSVSGAVWTTMLPGRLAAYLPEAEHGNIAHIVDDLNAALAYPRGSPERAAVDDAYIDVQRILNLLSIVALIPCLVSACYMKNVDLSGPEHGEHRHASIALTQGDRTDDEDEEEACSLLEEDRR